MDAAGYIRNDVSATAGTRSFHCTRMYNGKKCVIIPSGKPHGDDRGFSHICLLQSLYNFWNKMAGNYPKTVTQSALADIMNNFLTEKADRLSVFGQPLSIHNTEDSEFWIASP